VLNFDVARPVATVPRRGTRWGQQGHDLGNGHAAPGIDRSDGLVFLLQEFFEEVPSMVSAAKLPYNDRAGEKGA
jgi:hypothetical protein